MPGNISLNTEESKTESQKRTTESVGRTTYYSLGIVLDRDIKNGSFWPSYVLCFAHTTSNKRTGYRVVKQFNGRSKFNLPKVLVTSVYGHDDLLDYLSDYRTQDKMRGVHYYPNGALCWFETNQYGDPIGSVYYVRKIPDKKLLELPRRQRGSKRLSKKIYSIKDNFTKENVDKEEWPFKKLRFHQ